MHSAHAGGHFTGSCSLCHRDPTESMFTNALPPETAQWLIALWLLLFGAAVGSFLNVVIYRLPAGMSICWPGSHCPLCRHPIRWFDNVPVLSWVLLRGCCRDCRSPISIRYPLVEGGTAAIFLALAIHEIFGNAANLPARSAGPIDGGFVLAWTLPELLGIYAYHLILLCTLFAAALIDFDRKLPPARLFIPALLIGLLAPLGFPQLHPTAAWPGMADYRFAGFIDGLAGLLAGTLAGWLAARMGREPGRIEPGLTQGGTAGLPGSAACVGVMLGWQAVCMLTVLTAAVYRLLAVVSRRQPEFGRLPATTWLSLGALAWILGWAQLVAWIRLL